MSTVTIAFAGDVMLGRLVNEEIGRRAPDYFWGTVRPLLASADAVFANLECTITGHDRPWTRTPKVFHFRADPGAVDVLRAGNVRYVSLANNHTLDFEAEGLSDTLDHLDAAGIKHAGAGRTIEEAMAPALVRVGGLRVGVIALTDNEPAFAAGPANPGTYYTRIDTREETLEPIERRVTQLRGEGADLVVLSLHWGPNMVDVPPPRFRTFAHAVLDLGVDLLYGHSAHIFQAVERRGRGLVLYDTGDFLDDYATDPFLRNDWSFLFIVEADEKGLRRLRLAPVRLRFARTDLARGDEFEAIRNRMTMRCKPFGTPLTKTDEGLELTLEP